jgi:predicted dienelactone hydrolase
VVRRLITSLAALVLVAILLVAGLFAYLSVERRWEVALPAPTGSFAVGRAIYDWRDETTVDVLAPNPGTKREVLAWIWYPAVPGPSSPPDDYVPASVRAATGPGYFPFRFVYRDKSKVHAHSLRNAAFPPGPSSYPVVILRGGLATGVTTYSALAEDLASHGYVVVGVDAPYRTSLVVFPDGRVMRRTDQNDLELYPDEDLPRIALKLLAAWTSDMSFVLDRMTTLNASDPSGRFRGRLDMTRVGAFGHSFGGAQAAQFCHDDARCKAAIDVDGIPLGSVIQEGMHKPFMFLMEGPASSNSPPNAEVQHLLTDMRSVYAHLPPETRLSLSIRGANHFTFSDDGAVLSSGFLRGLLHLFGMLRIDGRRQLAVTAYCVHTLFDAYLKGTPTRPQLLSPQYPELEALDLQ